MVQEIIEVAILYDNHAQKAGSPLMTGLDLHAIQLPMAFRTTRRGSRLLGSLQHAILLGGQFLGSSSRDADESSAQLIRLDEIAFHEVTAGETENGLQGATQDATILGIPGSKKRVSLATAGGSGNQDEATAAEEHLPQDRLRYLLIDQRLRGPLAEDPAEPELDVIIGLGPRWTSAHTRSTSGCTRSRRQSSSGHQNGVRRLNQHPWAITVHELPLSLLLR